MGIDHMVINVTLAKRYDCDYTSTTSREQDNRPHLS